MESFNESTHASVKTELVLSEESEILESQIMEEDVKPFICMNCGEAFATQVDFRIHNVRCNGFELLPCLLCDLKFCSSKSLRKHLKMHGDFSTRSIVCTQCGKNFNDSSSFLIHETVCTSEHQEHASSEQDLTCDQPSQLEPYNIELNDLESVACTLCNKVFVNRFRLNAHMYRMHPIELCYSCKHCDMNFLRPIHLRRHILHEHADIRSFICVYCSKSFGKLNSLKVHEVGCRKERPHECAECGKKFTTAGQLKVHGHIHTGERPFGCDKCEQRFMTYSSLKAHKFEHTDERPFVCTECEKGFTMACYLRRHMLVHSGESPHPCPTCSKSFTQKSSLKRHLSVHKGERPYVCTDCGKTFTQASSLKGHKAVHIRSKPLV